jgi:hypothetical protein
LLVVVVVVVVLALVLVLVELVEVVVVEVVVVDSGDSVEKSLVAPSAVPTAVVATNLYS